MPRFNTEKYIHHPREKMFALVADIEHYPEFLPMCKDLIIRSSQKQDSKTFLIADMTVGYKLVRETFTTQVYLRPEENRIDVQYVDGPFRYLENRWLFLPMENKNVCRLEFFIEYEFKNSIFSLMMGSMFDAIFCKFTNAFEKRANEIYGIEN